MKYIVIAGNIGAGKTTLTEMLSEVINWKPRFEVLDKNPYLDHFYGDMKRWSFHLQMTFLSQRMRQYKEMEQEGANSIVDRSIYEDCYVFAANLREMGLLTQMEYETYEHIFQSIITTIKPPKLMLFLSANTDTLIQHIKKRGRDFEENIDVEYLESLNKKYNDWYNSYPYTKTLINVNKHKFSENFEPFDNIISEIKKHVSV